MNKNLRFLRAGMHILLVVSLPLAMVSFAIGNSTMTAGSTSAAATRLPQAVPGTFAGSLPGNTPGETGLVPQLLGTGILTLSSDNTYTLSITSHSYFSASAFADKSNYSIWQPAPCPSYAVNQGMPGSLPVTRGTGVKVFLYRCDCNRGIVSCVKGPAGKTYTEEAVHTSLGIVPETVEPFQTLNSQQ